MKNFLAGLGAGITLGMLVAPQSGRQTRLDLRRGTRRALQAARGRSEALGEAFRHPRSMLKTGREKVRDFGQRLREGAENMRGQATTAAQGDEIPINIVDREQLIAVYGIGPVLADRIIENRPYRSTRELVERGIIPESTFAELERELPKMRRENT
jgi:gas vesicle protein